MKATDVKELLGRLGLTAMNAGAWSGSRGWSASTSGPLIDVRNPSSGELLAQVRAATASDYEDVLSSAVATSLAWRQVPSPRRGEAVRLMAEELRQHKSDLGTLVSL